MIEDSNFQYFVGDNSQIVASDVYISADTYPIVIDKHNENVTTHLARAGPVGAAAAAAISSCRYFKSSYLFETDPVVRKRVQTKLLRKIKSTMDEYSCRVGQQVAMLNCVPSNKLPLLQQFKVYGSKKIDQSLKSQRAEIMMGLEKNLVNKMSVNHLKMCQISDEFKELPMLNVDGIPTGLDKMTQSQLRNFIPEMLRLSTGRLKPGWKRFEFCPIWWPTDVPWSNVRTDVRTDEERCMMSWTACLRSIVLSCYQYHNCEHLLADCNSSLHSTTKFEEEPRIIVNTESELTNMRSTDEELGDVVNESGQIVGELGKVEAKYEGIGIVEQLGTVKQELVHTENMRDEVSIMDAEYCESYQMINSEFVSGENRNLEVEMVQMGNSGGDSVQMGNSGGDSVQMGSIESERELNNVDDVHRYNEFPKLYNYRSENNATASQIYAKYLKNKVVDVNSPDESPLYLLKIDATFNSIDGRPVSFFKLSNKLN